MHHHHRCHHHQHRQDGEARHEALFMAGRHGRGFGRFRGGFGGGMDDQGFRSGRKLNADELQLLLLSLLATQPRHGYELIKALEEHSGGFYKPSPGVIYPALTYLEEVGYAQVQAEGTKKRYSLTAAGETYLATHRETAEAILNQLERIGGKMGRVREIFAGEASDEARGDGPMEIWLARHELKSALREKRHVDPQEAQRIAEILKRAAAAIRGEED